MQRVPEPELMDLPHEVDAYARADFREVNARFVERLFELTARHDEGASVAAVDLGCGPGEIPLMVAARRPSWRITAVDASSPMLDAARQRASADRSGANVQFHLADATRTGLTEKSFDVIFSNSLLHHVRDPAAMWREMARLARPGATLFVRDLRRPASEAEARAIVATHAGGETAMLREEFFRSLLAAYTPDEIRAQLGSAGVVGLDVAASSDRHVDVWGTPG